MDFSRYESDNSSEVGREEGSELSPESLLVRNWEDNEDEMEVNEESSEIEQEIILPQVVGIDLNHKYI